MVPLPGQLLQSDTVRTRPAEEVIDILYRNADGHSSGLRFVGGKLVVKLVGLHKFVTCLGEIAS